MSIRKTKRKFDYPDGDEVVVETWTELGAYWKATREKGPVHSGVKVHRIEERNFG